VSVVDLAVAGDDLVVATLGRSAWILDDLTPVREMDTEIAAAPAHLFEPPPAVRWRYASSPYGSGAGAGENPPQGALISYFLAAEPEGEIILEVLDGEGGLVRRLSSVLKPQYTSPDHPDWDPESEPKPDLEVGPGLHRASWDLRYEGARWVPGSRIDTGAPGAGPLVLPGDYTLKLTVGGRSLTRTLRVEPDPRSAAAVSDLEAQLTFALEVRDRMSRIADMVASLRGARQQLEARTALLADNPEAAGLVELGTKLAADLSAVEEAVHNPHAEVNYDILAGRDGGAKLYSRLSWLLGGADEHDGPPTQGMREVAAALAAELAAAEAKLAGLLEEDLPRLNAVAEQLELGFVLAP
jgi:hypothetical protein